MGKVRPNRFRGRISLHISKCALTKTLASGTHRVVIHSKAKFLLEMSWRGRSRGYSRGSRSTSTSCRHGTLPFSRTQHCRKNWSHRSVRWRLRGKGAWKYELRLRGLLVDYHRAVPLLTGTR